MENAQTKPIRRERGRPRVMDGDAVNCNVRMTREQRAKLDQLGGAAWVRERIDGAVIPLIEPAS